MRRQGDPDEYHAKSYISPFNENLHIKDFLDWLSEVNHIFYLMKILPARWQSSWPTNSIVVQFYDVIICNDRWPDRGNNQCDFGGGSSNCLLIILVA